MRVRPLDLPIAWDPGAPRSVVATDDVGRTAVALHARSADPDQSTVVLVFGMTYAVHVTPYDDEGIHQHPLWGAGLEDVRWVGEVHESEWVASFGPTSPVPRHFVMPTKEMTVEVAAETIEIRRSPYPPPAAAAAVLGG